MAQGLVCGSFMYAVHSRSGCLAIPVTSALQGHPRTRPPLVPCPDTIQTNGKGSSGSARSESKLERSLQATHQVLRVEGAARPHSCCTDATSAPEGQLARQSQAHSDQETLAGSAAVAPQYNMYLDRIPQGKIGGEFQMPQPHARHGAGSVASCQPPLYAQAVIRVACSRSTTASVAEPCKPCMLCSGRPGCLAWGAESCSRKFRQGCGLLCFQSRAQQSCWQLHHKHGAPQATTADRNPAEHRIWWQQQLYEPMPGAGTHACLCHSLCRPQATVETQQLSLA